MVKKILYPILKTSIFSNVFMVTPFKNTSKEHQEFVEKVTLGFRIAYEKLVRESALKNQTLVVSVKGKPVHVPAKKLLRQLQRNPKSAQ